MNIRVNDMVRTPHATNGRTYRVLETSEYSCGNAQVTMREIGAIGAQPITYPTDLLTRVGYYG